MTGDFKLRDSRINCSVSGGADAVRAINGTSVNALNPPRSANEDRKSDPLNVNNNHY